MHQLEVEEGGTKSVSSWMNGLEVEGLKINSPGFLPLHSLKIWWWRKPIYRGMRLGSGM